MSTINSLRRRLPPGLGGRKPTASETAWKSLRALKTFEAPDTQAGVFLEACRRNLAGSQSQLFQDAFVLSELSDKTGGFFVEFGATDGVHLSNTHLLENGYGWSGILAEPATIWRKFLPGGRGCAVDFRCVAARSGETVIFNETAAPEISTIDTFSAGDLHAAGRASGIRYEVQTVSLNDLLHDHGALKEFDYLSIDTEGSELDILSALDFNSYQPRIITVEHNHVEHARAGLHSLLTAQGYARKLEEFSDFDDWYVLR